MTQFLKSLLALHVSVVRAHNPLTLLAKPGSYTIHDKWTRRAWSTERPETRRHSAVENRFAGV